MKPKLLARSHKPYILKPCSSLWPYYVPHQTHSCPQAFALPWQAKFFSKTFAFLASWHCTTAWIWLLGEVLPSTWSKPASAVPWPQVTLAQSPVLFQLPHDTFYCLHYLFLFTSWSLFHCILRVSNVLGKSQAFNNYWLNECMNKWTKENSCYLTSSPKLFPPQHDTFCFRLTTLNVIPFFLVWKPTTPRIVTYTSLGSCNLASAYLSRLRSDFH